MFLGGMDLTGVEEVGRGNDREVTCTFVCVCVCVLEIWVKG